MKVLEVLATVTVLLTSAVAHGALAQVGEPGGSVPIRPPIKIEIVENSSWDIGHMEPSALPVPAKVGEAYDLLIAARGGGVSGYIWTVKGLPPEGLRIESVGGDMILIEGTPTKIGSYTTTMIATDRAYEHVKGEYTFTIKVNSQ